MVAMILKLFSRVSTVSLVLIWCLGSQALADEVVKPSAKKTDSKVVWNDDPLCQFVFFSVLEGLYRDGVQNEIVDLVIGDAKKATADGIKNCFVFRCELCHATFEAFRTYRSRPKFLSSNGQTTFGKGVSSELVKNLKGDARSRVYAMGSLVRPWIMQRIEETRKTAEEKEAMKKGFSKYSEKGAKILGELKRGEDPFYVDWSFYGSCQACEAAKDLGGH